MKRNVTGKKLMTFADYRTIDGFFKDMSEDSHLSEAYLMEKYLLSSFMPKDKQAEYWVRDIYGESGGIAQTLTNIFTYNSAGIMWRSVHDNLLPLVEFARSQSVKWGTIINGNESELPHCRSQFDSIILKLEEESEKERDLSIKVTYEEDIKAAKIFLRELKEEPRFSRFVNLYTLVINHWDILKDWSITYRFLADVTAMEVRSNDTPEERLELVSLIREMSDEWPAKAHFDNTQRCGTGIMFQHFVKSFITDIFVCLHFLFFLVYFLLLKIKVEYKELY